MKHTLRLFWQNRGFTFAAVAALAVGIGANTAIFSVVNAVLLKPPPFPDPERIVIVQNFSPQGSGSAASPAKFNHYREQTAVLKDAAAYRTGVINWTGGELPEQIPNVQASLNYFRVFGASFRLGGGFNAEQDRPNGPRAAVISQQFWERRFASDPGIVGKKIVLGGEPHEITGVVDESFDFRDLGRAPDVFVPFQLDPNSVDQGHYFAVAARLVDGVSVERAQAQMKASGEAFRAKYPNAIRPDQSFTVQPLRQALAGNIQTSLLILEVAVGLVLLIACSNVANLLLARAVSRKREIAIRAAVGASRWTIIRQLLMESVMLAAAGAVLGFIGGMTGIRALLSINTAGLPRVGADGALVTADWRVLLFTVGVALLTSVVFGLIPALQASRADLSATLKESGNRSGTGLRQNASRTVLVVVELALAVVLVIGAALMIRTSMNLAAVKPGYQTENILTMKMSLTGQRFLQAASVERLVRDGADRLKALPGVEIATASCCLPLEGGYGLGFRVIGRALETGQFHGGGGWAPVSPGYFEAFKIPVIKGRAFDERDNAAGAPVVIINQAMARQFWPNGDPMNDRILIGKGAMPALELEQPRQIIGIIGDVRDNALNAEPQPRMFIPISQQTDAINALNVRLTPLAWVIRTRGNPATLSTAIQDSLRQVSGLPIANVRTMDEIMSRSTSRERFNMLLMTIFGFSALFLAAIGVYGLMAYAVQQRTQEIGIRLALGAQTGDVRRMVIVHGMKFAVAGILVGTGAAWWAAAQIANFLFQVTPRDPAIFTAVPLFLIAVALAAVWLPALRATRVDPVIALRAD